MKSELKPALKSINLSWLFAKNLEHGISYQRSNWELFEPSKFIYSFFTFNMLYDYDWYESLKRGYSWDNRKFDFTSDKIYFLLDFIYTHIDESEFINYYKKYDKNLCIIQNSSRINSDKNIERKDSSELIKTGKSFYENYKIAIGNLNEQNFTKQDHYMLLVFCYQIRNNIFHGLKKASEMIKSGQRERLNNYSNIILATIEMFFDILEEEYEYVKATEDEIRENAQSGY